MDKIRNLMEGDTAQFILGILIFFGALALVILLYRWVISKIQRKIAATDSKIDDFVVEMFKLPFLVLLIWIMVTIFTHTVFFDSKYTGSIQHVLTILLIIMMGWILIKSTRILFYYMEKKLELKKQGNFQARGSLTKLTIFERMISGLIVIITIAVCLMTFDKIRDVGIGLLSSAGIAGVVLGFAAQKSLGSVMAGIQIAITQPIKLDDQVIVQGQSGNIEEINLTYVVVKLWDERRLILPINYFLDNPIENWTRNSSNITGTVFIYVDFRMPIEPIRQKVKEILKNNPDWDGRTASIDITNMTDSHLEVRIVVSSSDAGRNFSLQVDLREKLVQFIQDNYSDFFPNTRIKQSDQQG